MANTFFIVTIVILAIVVWVLGSKLIDTSSELKITKFKLEAAKKESAVKKSESGVYYKRYDKNDDTKIEVEEVEELEPGIYRKYNKEGHITGKVFKFK